MWLEIDKKNSVIMGQHSHPCDNSNRWIHYPYDAKVGDLWNQQNKRVEKKPLTIEQQIKREHDYASSELDTTDIFFLPDYPITEEQKSKVLEYRKKLRNPYRENHSQFPDPNWRPIWPKAIKRPS